MAENRIGIELAGKDGETFRITERLGGGRFGEVYMAVSQQSGAKVAIKMAAQEKLDDPFTIAVKSVRNEVRVAMLEVEHPNVVRIFHVDKGADESIGPYVIMELVEGSTLHGFIRDRSAAGKLVSLEEALQLMRGIALGAQAINEHLIHRDIKPDNILLDYSTQPPRPKVADFGIARPADGSTRPETFKGTQALWYMAPEVWRREQNTRKIDVYSVGLVFYEILSLKHPLLRHIEEEWDFHAWGDAHLNKSCPDIRELRPEISLPLARLLLNMTHKVPGRRPEWEEVISALTLPSEMPPRAQVDPSLLHLSQQKANERFRAEQAQTAAELERQRVLELRRRRHEEYVESENQLVERFDEVIEELNQHQPSYPITVNKQPSNPDRIYILPNGHFLVCTFFQFQPKGLSGPLGNIIGGGYMRMDGGLSANLALVGRPEDIASAVWVGIEVTAYALASAELRAKIYKDAGLDNQAIRFIEGRLILDNSLRDAPKYFGIRDADLFYAAIQKRGAHSYSLHMSPSVFQTFNDILKVGFYMPDRSQSRGNQFTE